MNTNFTGPYNTPKDKCFPPRLTQLEVFWCNIDTTFFGCLERASSSLETLTLVDNIYKSIDKKQMPVKIPNVSDLTIDSSFIQAISDIKVNFWGATLSLFPHCQKVKFFEKSLSKNTRKVVFHIK